MRRPGLVALLVLLVLGSAAWAQPRKDGAELGDKERTLQQTQRQLREERAKAVAARNREASLLVELEETEKRLAAKRRQVAALDARIKRAQSDIATLQADIGRLETQRGGQEEALARRLQEAKLI